METSLFWYALGVGVLVALIGSVVWVNISSRDDIENDKLVVAATIAPLADIAQQVGGEFVEVVTIVPPGASPHSYTLSPQQVVKLQEAHMVFYIGHGIDDAVVQSFKQAIGQNTIFVVVDHNITIRPFTDLDIVEPAAGEEEHAHEAGDDPHYWLTVPNAKNITDTVRDSLISLDPTNTESYNQQAAAYQQELDALQEELKSVSAKVSQKAFIAMHNAWSYFTAEYGLQLVGVYEPIEGQESSPADIQQLQEVIEKFGITTFYSEPQKASTPATRFFRDELGLRIDVLNAEGGGSYVDLMRSNMEAIARGTSGR